MRSGQNPNIDDDTRVRARRFVEDAGMPKPAVTGRTSPKQRVVSKKELEESGLSLRDFLNKERGLTRRGMGKAEAEKQLGMGEKPTTDAVAKAKERLGIGSEPMLSTVKPGTNVNYENTETSDMTYKRGGKVTPASKRADGVATRGKTRCKIC